MAIKETSVPNRFQANVPRSNFARYSYIWRVFKGESNPHHNLYFLGYKDHHLVGAAIPEDIRKPLNNQLMGALKVPRQKSRS